MLVLVRHGQSQANSAGLLVGRSDSPLTELGRRQALALAEALVSGGTTSRRMLTSPLRRATETASVIAAACGGASVTELAIDARFVELDYGDLDETAPSQLPAGTWERWCADTSWRPPGGETLLEVSARVTAACEELSEEAAAGDVLIVSHVSPIKAAVAWSLGAGPELSWRLRLGVASITRIATGGERGPHLVSFNETAHLAGLA